MTTTALIRPPQASSRPEPWSDAGDTTRPEASAQPDFRERLEELLPLIAFVPVAGPPAILVAGPWVLLALMVAGPVVLILTLVALLLAAAALIALIGAILASPYLVVRHVRRHRAERAPKPAPEHAPSARLIPGGTRWSAA
jgi:hypothetical protein